RWKGADNIYLGPNGLADWKETGAKGQWREEGGQLVTEKPGAALFGDVGIPEQARIDVEISWRQKPDFVFALGVDERDMAARQAFQFEVWDGELVVVGESNRDADVALVQPVGKGEGHVRFQVYLDQKQGRLILLSPSGKILAAVRIKTKIPARHTGVRLTNRTGDVRLEHLRVRRWDGQLLC